MSLLFFISKLISLFYLINFLINQLFLNSIKINMQLIELLDFNMTGIKLSSFLYSNCCYGHFLKSFHLFFSIFWIINYSKFQLIHLYNFLDFLSTCNPLGWLVQYILLSFISWILLFLKQNYFYKFYFDHL